MTVYPIAVAVAAVVGACTIWWRLHRLQAHVRRFHTAARLTEAAHHRDTQALVAMHRAVELREQVLTEAEQIVSAEYARTTRHNPQEGDTP